VVFSITPPPLEVRMLLYASLACTVSVEVLVPLAGMEAGLGLIEVLTALAGPATKFTEPGFPMTPPAMVPVILAVPAVVEEVNIAV
jgi:hypothetical protein